MTGASSFSVAASSSSAGAGAVGGQHRVAAGDQPLAGEVRRGDLGEVLLVEEDSWSGPSSAISFLIAGARSAVIQLVGVWPGRPVLQLVQGADPGAR